MRIDGITAEIVQALRTDGVRPIVLKGPAVAQWLYDEIGDRLYTDSDLLVSPGELPAAEGTLRSLGFASGQSGWLAKSREWRRGSDLVDLHTSFFGIEAGDSTAWALLSADAQPISVGGITAAALCPAARALHLTLHAAQHESAFARPRADLERALVVLPREIWHEAARLAQPLGAAGALAAGLRRVGAADLVEELGLGSTPSPAAAALRAADPPPGALGISELAAATSVRARLTVLGRGIVPRRDYMRRHYTVAGWGPPGLAAAYVLRLARLGRHLPNGLSAWRGAQPGRR
jgi:Uncharacterised nucleotidyltransferase